MSDGTTTEEAIRRYAKELKRSNQELEEFASVASHDLQAPLRQITGYTQILAGKLGDADLETRELLAAIINGARRMQSLILDLLRFSQVGRAGAEFKPVRIEPVLREVMSNLELSVRDSSADVSWGPMPTVLSDRVQMLQLFQNLVENAIKYRSAEAPRVRISAEREGDEWVFSVRDNGIGISPEHAHRIFLVFQRLHPARKYPGTGIGLAICKKIVDLHGGRIWVESEPGRGADFRFTFPADGEGKARSAHHDAD